MSLSGLRNIPTSSPSIGASEREAVLDALDRTELSGLSGENIVAFEHEFSAYCDTSEGVATSSGTTALHLAAASLGLHAGQSVLVTTLTNMATFFAVLQCGATPIPIDVEPDTGNLNPQLLDDALQTNTVGVIVVHLFGHPVDMDPVMEFCKLHGLWLIEDAAEAHGATYMGKKVGAFGDAGCFSFFGNKIITTGEGGMITYQDDVLAEWARRARSLSFGVDNRFMHTGMGYNYRLSNLQAAIGRAQLAKIEDVIAEKRSLTSFYNEAFKDIEAMQIPIERPGCRSVFWMYHILLDGEWRNRRPEFRADLLSQGIETRECFVPFDQQEFFVNEGVVKKGTCPVAEYWGTNGLYLPSGPNIAEEDRLRVVDAVSSLLEA
jgi:perosamine synthetase